MSGFYSSANTRQTYNSGRLIKLTFEAIPTGRSTATFHFAREHPSHTVVAASHMKNERFVSKNKAHFPHIWLLWSNK